MAHSDCLRERPCLFQVIGDGPFHCWALVCVNQFPPGTRCKNKVGFIPSEQEAPTFVVVGTITHKVPIDDAVVGGLVQQVQQICLFFGDTHLHTGSITVRAYGMACRMERVHWPVNLSLLNDR